MPSASGELVICRISHDSAIICTWPPTLEKIKPGPEDAKITRVERRKTLPGAATPGSITSDSGSAVSVATMHPILVEST